MNTSKAATKADELGPVLRLVTPILLTISIAVGGYFAKESLEFQKDTIKALHALDIKVQKIGTLETMVNRHEDSIDDLEHDVLINTYRINDIQGGE